MTLCIPHHYIDRVSGEICLETLPGDREVNLIYSRIRENASFLFKALTGSRITDVLACLNYDVSVRGQDRKIRAMIRDLDINTNEMLEPERIRTARQLFERKIIYWACRPMPHQPEVVVSPCDARMLPCSLSKDSQFFIKDKFFDCEDLLGGDHNNWQETFDNGACAVFRLTPDKYHYNHMPVTGRVVDIYELTGKYHSCNPSAVIEVVTPYSKNKRVVTVLDTDISGGSGCGLVAMVEVVALMIGDIAQVYSDVRYDNPRPIRLGDVLRKGQPKSLFRPGSSTVVLMFQQGRFKFSCDLLHNAARVDVPSRFSKGFGQSLVETDLLVRSPIGTAKNQKKSLRRPSRGARF